jgi:hypothetical protein
MSEEITQQLKYQMAKIIGDHLGAPCVIYFHSHLLFIAHGKDKAQKLVRGLELNLRTISTKFLAIPTAQ